MRVDVYMNLHKGEFSVKALEGENKGRVIAHSWRVSLRDCTFVVQPAGQARVRREGRKHVHAFVRGELVTLGNDCLDPLFNVTRKPKPMERFTYNPYKHDTFVEWLWVPASDGFYKAGAPVLKSAFVYMDNDFGCFAEKES